MAANLIDFPASKVEIPKYSAEDPQIEGPTLNQTKAPSSKINSQKRRQMGKKTKQYWLLKTEPGDWSWEDQAANGGLTNWDGVKNKQAQKHLRAMKLGDLCLFYHSGTSSRRVVGVVSVVREAYEDNNGLAVDVQAIGEMRRQVNLKEMKQEDALKGFVLFRQPRLSVVPVSEDIWGKICELGGGFEGDGDDGGDNCEN